EPVRRGSRAVEGNERSAQRRPSGGAECVAVGVGFVQVFRIVPVPRVWVADDPGAEAGEEADDQDDARAGPRRVNDARGGTLVELLREGCHGGSNAGTR